MHPSIYVAPAEHLARETQRLLAEAEARWPKLSTTEQIRERESLIAMITHMPVDDRTAALGYAHDHKMLSDNEFEEQLIRLGATLERNKKAGNDDLYADSVFAAEVYKLNPDKQEILWRAINKKAERK